MQFGIKVQTYPPTHETAPLFLYKQVILATHSYVSIGDIQPKTYNSPVRVLTDGHTLTDGTDFVPPTADVEGNDFKTLTYI